MITIVGEFFSRAEPFGIQEHNIFNSIKTQIENKFPNCNNLIINATWLGPQFDNKSWPQIQTLIHDNKKFDNLFWTGLIDPITILPSQLKEIEQALCSNKVFYIGVSFDEGPHSFNTSAIVCQEEFPAYTENELKLTNLKFLFLNYNRKPKPHRIMFVEKLHTNSLEKYGLISLGKPEAHYDVTQGLDTDKYYIINDQADATNNGRFPLVTTFGGAPADFCSLGDLTVWQTHFLNVVSETEFLPWDNIFVTEKTWKPIIGLRPFVLNGQTKIYKYLRDNGFNTFNHYWPHIEMEDLSELQVHDSIIEVIQFLSTLSNTTLLEMYADMLPALEHNRNRFFEFVKEQQYKAGHLFV